MDANSVSAIFFYVNVLSKKFDSQKKTQHERWNGFTWACQSVLCWTLQRSDVGIVRRALTGEFAKNAPITFVTACDS